MMKNLMSFVPALFALAYVAMSAMTFTFIDETSIPVDKDEESKREKARTASLVNLVLACVVLVLTMYIYFKTFKAQKQYITYF